MQECERYVGCIAQLLHHAEREFLSTRILEWQRMHILWQHMWGGTILEREHMHANEPNRLHCRTVLEWQLVRTLGKLRRLKLKYDCWLHVCRRHMGQRRELLPHAKLWRKHVERMHRRSVLEWERVRIVFIGQRQLLKCTAGLRISRRRMEYC